MARRDLTGVVDFSVLEAMTGGDDAINDEVLGLFSEQASLWTPLLDPKADGWRDAVHTIRGAASGIGGHELVAACADAELSEDELAAPALERVRSALSEALADVAAYRHELLLKSLRR